MFLKFNTALHFTRIYPSTI